MSLIATGTAPALADLPLGPNNGFWPAIDPAAMRAAHRLDGTVTPARLHAALLIAQHECNRLLRVFQADQQAAGKQTAAAIALEPWQAEGHYTDLYCHAVYSTALAWLIERYSGIGAAGRAATIDSADDSTTADIHRAAARNAIAEIYCSNHVTAELI